MHQQKFLISNDNFLFFYDIIYVHQASVSYHYDKTRHVFKKRIVTVNF
jgi:hypothetical protein